MPHASCHVGTPPQVNTVYCLMPVAIKGLLGNQEGIVMKKSASGGGFKAGSVDPNLWRILMRAPGKQEAYLQVRLVAPLPGP